MNPQTWTDHPAQADAAVKMQAVLDSATQVSIIATNLDGLITVFNSGAERMLGHRAKDVVGRQTPEIIHLASEVEARGRELTQEHGRTIQGFGVFVNQAWQGNHEEREWTYVRKDGTFLAVNLIVTAVADSTGTPIGFLGVARDITQAKRAEEEIRRLNRALARRVHERTIDLEEARLEALARLALAAELRDDDTGQHTQRVGRLSALLAHSLGLADDQVEMIRRAAPLHDVGKIGIPDAILLKPGRLESHEFTVMKRHTNFGGEILSKSRSPLLRCAEQIALTHHECWDGSGYPLGLRQQEIPLVGRIVSVVDVFDALTHARPYKAAWPADQAASEIQRLSGHKFDPLVVQHFLEMFEQPFFSDESAFRTDTEDMRYALLSPACGI